MQECADRVIELYERHAHAWDADRSRAGWNDQPWHDRFLATVPSGGSILDLGCGSGSPVGQHMVARGFRVTGVDASPTLISLCRQRLPNQEWLIGDMRSPQLARRFDGVLAWDSFFHLTPDDQRRMFAVFAEHAAPSCVLMFNTGLAQGESIGKYRGEALYHASLSGDEYRELIRGIGFAVVAHAAEDWPTGGGRTVWLARRA